MSLKDLQNLISSKFSSDDIMAIVSNCTDLEQITVDEINITPSSQKIGDSYLSKIVRFSLKVSGTNKRGLEESLNIHVIAKTLPPNLGRRQTFRSTDFFENEVIFYDKVWSSFREFYKSKNIDEFDNLVPLLLAYKIDGKNDFICLEDISYKNYESVERGNGVDLKYTMIVMDLFAKFHSLSLAFKDQKPDIFQEVASSLKETYFSDKFYGWYRNLQNSLIDLVMDAVKQELPEPYHEKIGNIFSHDFYKKISDICETGHGHLSGITQGDAWIPNFLFKAKEGDSLQVTLIDFQLARWSFFSNDVTFFLFTCVEQNILKKHWNEIISEYSTRMKKYLSILGSSPDLFTIENFKKDMKQNIIFTVGMTIEALPMSLIDGFDLDVIKGDEAVPLESIWVMRPFKDKERRQKVANIMKFMVDIELI